MDECETSVTLGYTVCALSVYAEFCIRDVRFDMGASAMASGRSPSMDRISARET
jgi:hypothetical protein